MPSPAGEPAPQSPRQACVIFNPTARGEKAARMQAALSQLGSRFELCPTTCAGDAIRLAREKAEAGANLVVAAGGDGTVSEVVDGLMSVAPLLQQSVALGVIPLGTVNVFAAEMGIPHDLDASLELLSTGSLRRCCIPAVQCRSHDGAAALHRHFIQLAGAGLDSRAIRAVRWELKKRWGKAAYVEAGFRALREVCAPVRVVSAEHSAEGGLVLIGNGRYYGGRFVLFPDASMDDPRLEVVVYPQVHAGTLAGFGLGWLMGNVHRFTGARRWLTRRVELTCEELMPVELDGDNAGSLPAIFTATERTLDVLARDRIEVRPQPVAAISGG